MSTIPWAQSQHSSAALGSFHGLQAGLSPGQEEEAAFATRDGDGMWLIGLGGQRDRACMVPWGSEGVQGTVLLLHGVLLIGRSMEGLGGTL